MIGRTLMLVGLALLAIGAIVYGVERMLDSRGWRMPGDFVYRGDGWRVYLPLGTALLVSLILTVLLNLALRLLRR